MRLYVGSLHFNITEDMLRSIFEPFGKIEHMQLMIDTETGRSKGYGFITVKKKNLRIRLTQIISGFFFCSEISSEMPKMLKKQWNS